MEEDKGDMSDGVTEILIGVVLIVFGFTFYLGYGIHLVLKKLDRIEREKWYDGY